MTMSEKGVSHLAVFRMRPELLEVASQHLPEDLPVEQGYVVIEMDDIQCLTSIQIVTLVAWYRRLEEQQRRVSLVHVGDSLAQVFNLLRLHTYFNIQVSTAAVIAQIEEEGVTVRSVIHQDTNA